MKGFAVYSIEGNFFKIEYEEGNLTALTFLKEVPEHLGTKVPLTEEVARQIREYLKGTRQQFTLPFLLKGTPFQKQVWEALCQIPYGETRTYKEIAQAIGNPQACRAVGRANHYNPIMMIVPCHRVIGAKGKLVGYAAGISLKEMLLKLEQENQLKKENFLGDNQ